MDKKNILIICIIIILLVMSILIAYIFIINKENKNLEKNSLETQNSNVINEQNKLEIKKVTDKTKFFTVSNCISQYLNEINKNNSKYYGTSENGEYEKIVEEDYIKQNIYKLLSKEYIEKEGITKENVYNYVENITTPVMFIPMEMNVLEGSDVEKYVAYGIISNGKNEYIKEIYIIINLDINNKTFSVEQINEKHTNIDEIQLINQEIKIDKKDNNTFKYENPTPEYIIKQYFDMYKKLTLSNPEIAYNYLDKEYKLAKFKNLEEYKKYIEKRKDKISTSTITEYKTNKKDNYQQYICKTQTGDYYIFKEKGIMEYTVILDTYTIDIPEYIEKYNKSSEQERVALCIDKFIKNINDENYTLAYKMLHEGFKNNYFKTQESFENYVKQNFLGKEKIEYKNVQNEAKIYIYTVNLSGNQGNIEKKFNVRLGEGVNFEISFNM